MIFNFLLGFVIPWIAGIYLYKKDSKTVLLVTPFAIALAVIVDLIGSYFNFWALQPLYDLKTISLLPSDIGIYPVMASYLIYSIQRWGQYKFLLIVLHALIMTGIEWFGVIIGRLTYGSGWTIQWSGVAYLVAFVLTYTYYRCLVQKEIWLPKTKG